MVKAGVSRQCASPAFTPDQPCGRLLAKPVSQFDIKREWGLSTFNACTETKVAELDVLIIARQQYREAGKPTIEGHARKFVDALRQPARE